MLKKVLIFSTAYFPLVGGAEVAIKEITDRMDTFGFDLITARIRKDLPKEEKIGNVHVYRVGWGSALDKFLLPILGLPLALRLYKKNNYTLAWAMMASQASVLAVFFAKLRSVKLLTTLQEGDEESHLKRYTLGFGFLYKLFIRPWHRLAIKRANHVQVISNYLRDRAEQVETNAPVTVIPNGVDINKFSQTVSETEKQTLRSTLNIVEGEKIVISISRLVYKNAIDILVRAMKAVDGAKCIIVGTGQDKDALRALSTQLGIDDKVIFVGNIENEQIPSYLAISDIFVRPSRSEGQGIAFIEAMAVGVPIIATPVGGIVDFLHDNETGLFCEVDDPEDLAEKIRTLLSDSSLSEKISNNAKKLVREKYDWNKITPEMEKLFNQVMHE